MASHEVRVQFLNILSNCGGGQLQGSSREKVAGSFFSFGYIVLEASSHPVTPLQEAMMGMLLLFRTVTEFVEFPW